MRPPRAACALEGSWWGPRGRGGFGAPGAPRGGGGLHADPTGRGRCTRRGAAPGRAREVGRGTAVGRTTRVGESRLKSGHKPVTPALSHSPSSSASCTSRRPSSSQTFIFRAKRRQRCWGQRAEARRQLRARAGARGVAAGEGRRLGAGAAAGRGGRLGRHSWRIRFHEEEHSFWEKVLEFFFF